MFVLMCATLLFSLGCSTADTGAPVLGRPDCQNGYCITLSEGAITAEAGLCVVIPCLFTTGYSFTTKNMVWYKCEPSKQRCADSDIILPQNKNNRVQSGFKGQVSLLEPDVNQRTCSIIINDLTESDSGSYQFRVSGLIFGMPNGFTFSPKAIVSVKGLTQKPTVMVPPLTEGQQTTLTCTAPGLCSGSVPTITWTWRGAGEDDSHISGNITAFKTENLTAVTQRHSSTLTFNPSAEHHGSIITCKVGFTNGITTEETVTLNVTSVQAQAPGAVLPWVVVAGVSLIVNVICIILLMFLWNTRNKVKPKQEDRTYMSLKRTDLSPEYDVIAQPLH
ncbi:sialic acid-binding Ig-like lectin 14 [Centropristis striata]|uniref:sialic acid-binding Ig-like lectin 14 n=1 Tax=Centropristis striata TaxID=184440 RepID=UPI0027E137EB|nr:sialic acid-binding Ig-like lectin 14 [Centropristis striata]XP_059195209.1 sialic acid-binding Ig-like lectin 14 [Centropristis striata]